IIGRIELQGVNRQHITSVKTVPDIANGTVKVNLSLAQAPTKSEKITLSAEAFNSQKNHPVKPLVISTVVGRTEYEVTYPMGKEVLLWSEFSPALYRLTAKLSKSDIHSVTFGMCEFKAVGKQYTINGTQTFLRGKHDACVFPLTAYTPMNVDEWRRYFSISKEYGINHVRFHSWCPPAACFEAADLEGIYLQPELTIWGRFSTEAKELMDFLFKDGEQIQLEYGNSPSFVMFALGNELSGDVSLMRSFIDRFRKIDNRHAYALGSNNFLGRQGSFEGEDFFVTCRVGADDGFKTHVRASFSFADAYDGGYLNNYYPNSTMTFDGAVERSTVPVIGHETGQFQVFPNFDEMKKYTGVLEPRNFEVFRKRIEKAGMLDQAMISLKHRGHCHCYFTAQILK
ncbi:MAG: beta-glycosidase, partial [Bacteroides sp.]